MENRSRNWCFTLNNYTEEEYSRLLGLEHHKQLKYIIFGKEKGEKETPHLQGYISFFNAKTFNQTVKFFDNERYHLEKALGNAEENIAYCSKDNEYVEFGTKPEQGTRTDLKYLKKKLDEGLSYTDTVQECFTECAKYSRFALSTFFINNPKDLSIVRGFLYNLN